MEGTWRLEEGTVGGSAITTIEDWPITLTVEAFQLGDGFAATIERGLLTLSDPGSDAAV